VIDSSETEIRCEWTSVDGKMEGNEACDRIRRLIDDYLVELAPDRSGWEILFVDPGDGRFWELTFPLGYMHGGGPPLLAVISEAQARGKYGEGAAWSRQ
jgi:Immunity protein 27